jgi:hypothetical protein
MDPRRHGSRLAQRALRVGWREIKPTRQPGHEQSRVRVSFAAARINGYHLGCRKSGIMYGAEYLNLVADHRRHIAVRVLVLPEYQDAPAAAMVDRQPVNNRTIAAGHPAPGHDPRRCDTLDPSKGLG